MPRPAFPRPVRSPQLLLETLEDRWVPAVLSFMPDELLVSFRPGTPAAAMEQARGAVRGSVAEIIHTPAMEHSGAQPVQVLHLGGMAVDKAVAVLAKNPNVAFAEPNYLVTKAATSNDPYYTGGSLWGMGGGNGSNADAAWAAGYTGSKAVYVGIIDEGYQYTHPDLAANAAVNPGEIAGDGIDNDRNGYVDDVQGWDFANNDRTVYDGTADDHGTHVAGTIGGVGGNGAGVAGVNWNVSLLDAKFLGTNGGTIANAVKAVDYFTDLKVRHGLNIVATNNSWGGGGYSQALYDAIGRANAQNILFVAAAGNSSLNTDTTASYPAGYTNPNVISVAAIDSAGGLASFSNYGATSVDLGAPGVGIWSSVPSNSYASYSGTSMATPHVTGAVALYASKYPTASAAAIKNALLASAAPTGSLAGKTVTGGRLDVSAALAWSPSGELPATVSISDVSAAEGASGTTTAFTFTVTLSRPVAGGLTLGWSTADGTATVANSDYQAVVNQSLVFLENETSKTLTVTVKGDGTVEANENFLVRLSLPTGSGAQLLKAQGSGTILNDDSSSGGGKPRAKSASTSDLTLLDAALISLLTDQGKKTA